MGPFGKTVKLQDDAPTHPGMLGAIVNICCDLHLYYIQFDDGLCEWIHIKHIVGIRRIQPDSNRFPIGT
jgi:hypothetical protein